MDREGCQEKNHGNEETLTLFILNIVACSERVVAAGRDISAPRLDEFRVSASSDI